MKKTLSRRGSTLAELVVVMALVAIVSLIIVSFSSMAYSFADRNEEEYLFLEECADAEAALRQFVAEMDDGTTVCGGNYIQTADLTKNLWVSSATETKKAYLEYGSAKIEFDAIQSVTFEKYTANLTNANALIRCTLKGEGAREQSFLLVLRCATNGGDVNV